jgi:hypothetical protein
MGYITDNEAAEFAKQIFPSAQYEDFIARTERMRHLQNCVATQTPSPRCKLTDPAENLEWCQLGMEIEGAAFESYLQVILMAQDKDLEGAKNLVAEAIRNKWL